MCKTDIPVTVKKDEARSVVFEIDTDASIVPQADGTLKFIPVVKTTFE